MAAGSRREKAPRRTSAGGGSMEPANRELILDAAQRMFADAGYAATSTAKIAAAAGVPHGLVFYYFPSKRDLLLTVVGERAYQGSLLTSDAEPGHHDVGEILTAAARGLIDVFARNRDTQLILFREAATDPELHAMVSRLVASSTGDLAELLARATDAPADSDSRLAAARLLMSSLLMDNFLHHEAPDSARVEDEVRLLADGLRRPNTKGSKKNGHE
jgi:AcrR family transcriptional regulator